jgi:acetyl-CoA C-acetyltransferase
MEEIVIAAVGQTPVGEHWELSLRDLAQRAYEAVCQDTGSERFPASLAPEALYVGNMLAPELSGQAHMGVLLADHLGLKNIEALTVEAGGASGGAALRQGIQAVAAGQANAVLVMGVEKITDQIGPGVESAIATSLDYDFEAVPGLTLTAQAALLMRRYLHETNAPRSAFGGFAINAHANGAKNPNAMFRSAISAEMYEKAAPVSNPLNLFDVAPVADGAAALLVTRQEQVPPGWPHPLVRVAGSGMANDRLALHDRPDLLSLNASRISVEKACQQAGMHPGEMDLFELYDAYTILTVLALEASKLAERGLGWKLAEEGKIGLDGLVPLSTFGGLKARGNPGGAAGVYQAVEAVLQLRGEAGANQVAGAKRALVQCLGGMGAVAVTHVFEK